MKESEVKGLSLKKTLRGIVVVLGVVVLVWMALGALIVLSYILTGTEERERVWQGAPMPTPTVTPTTATAPTVLPLPTHVPVWPATPSPAATLGQPHNVSRFGLFSGLGGAAFGGDYDSPSVEDVLEEGLYVAGASPTHIAFRGEASAGSVRCDWRGDARTLGQRESSIRFWLGMDDDESLPSVALAETRIMHYINQMSPLYRDSQKASTGSMGICQI